MEEKELNLEELEREEPIESKIQGIQAMIDQMKRMVEENKRKIAEGDDVEGREFLMKHLLSEISNNEKKIEELKAQL